MAEIRTVRTARKAHDCESHPCARTIQPGDRYLLAALPPNDEGSPGWWLRMKVCQPCAERWGQALDEQATPRRSRQHTPPARHASPLDTVPSRPHRDEPRLDRPVTTVHLPALEATNA